MNIKGIIINSYKELDRSYFMDEYKEDASSDRPFPIGHGQIISRSSLVLDMILLLEPDESSRVLEIGTRFWLSNSTFS
ncbi:MAG TPA: hypothetical protein VK071_08980 [Tissierellales bacterium]|nr:hypothetical protein [Tissierellales bacterium]